MVDPRTTNTKSINHKPMVDINRIIKMPNLKEDGKSIFLLFLHALFCDLFQIAERVYFNKHASFACSLLVNWAYCIPSSPFVTVQPHLKLLSSLPMLQLG